MAKTLLERYHEASARLRKELGLDRPVQLTPEEQRVLQEFRRNVAGDRE